MAAQGRCIAFTHRTSPQASNSRLAVGDAERRWLHCSVFLHRGGAGTYCLATGVLPDHTQVMRQHERPHREKTDVERTARDQPTIASTSANSPPDDQVRRPVVAVTPVPTATPSAKPEKHKGPIRKRSTSAPQTEFGFESTATAGGAAPEQQRRRPRVRQPRSRRRPPTVRQARRVHLRAGAVSAVRGLVAIVLAISAALTMSTRARAGTYDVWGCRLPMGMPPPSPDGNPREPPTTCARARIAAWRRDYRRPKSRGHLLRLDVWSAGRTDHSEDYRCLARRGSTTDGIQFGLRAGPRCSRVQAGGEDVRDLHSLLATVHVDRRSRLRVSVDPDMPSRDPG